MKENLTRRILRACTLVAGLLPGCGSDAWFGNGPGADADVSTPAGVQTGDVEIAYTLTAEKDTTTDVTVSYSTDGATFQEASEGTGGDGTSSLTAGSAGEPHTFVWDSAGDLGGERESAVVVRVKPDDGTAGVTSSFSVHNGRFLAAVENASAGRVRLYGIDVVDGGLDFKEAVASGGQDPYDIIHVVGFFLIANQTTRDVSVLKLDEENETLTAVSDSPFRGDGVGSKYLAADGEHVFLSNPGDETLSIFDLDGETGALALNAHSGVAAAGCQSLAARSGRLYVACQTGGEILIFDITSDGELLTNAASPVAAGGIVSPRALVVLGTRLYAANFGAATICGFNIQGSGDLSPLGGSPFAVSIAGAEQLAQSATKLFAVNGAGAALAAFTVDAFGAVTEDAGSPFALTGPAFTAAAAGSVVVAATTTSKKLEVWTIDSSGALAAAASSPTGTSAEIVRIAISD